MTIDEYPSMGQELDVFSVSSQGRKLMVEIIWTSSRTHFLHDMNILQASDAEIKIVIVNPEIYTKQNLVRIFQKTRISEMKKENLVSEMLDGKKVLEDYHYLTNKVKIEILELISQSKTPLKQDIESLKAELLSKKELSPILSKCIGLCKQLRLADDSRRWLENELYGYHTDKREITSSDQQLSEIYPHNPEYRHIQGEVRIVGGYDENTGRRLSTTVKYPLFLAQPISSLEEICNISGEEFFMNVDIDELPDTTRNILKEFSPETKAMPIVFKKQAFRKSIENVRLSLHRFLDEISHQ